MQTLKFKRRELIQMLGFGMVVSSLSGKSWASAAASQVQSAFQDGAGVMRIDVSSFPVLNEPFGSIRIGTSPLDSEGHYPLGLFKPVLINRGPSLEWFVMSAECTHEGCSVPTFNPEAGLMICPCHGSQYEIDGTVVMGPAMQSLFRYPFKIQNNILSIQIPDLFYEISIHAVSESTDRLALQFLGFSAIDYQVFFKEALNAIPVSSLFALTPDGPFSERRITGIDDYMTVYLPKPKSFGFYEVAMATMPV
ncbi:MAG: ubiquinol-cytochrome c reductase iron-sulfur subunit [Verrucomicrobiota bacterium]